MLNVIGIWNQIIFAIKTVLANKKSTIFARMVAKTKIVLGKYIFVNRPELLIKDDAAELNELEKRFQGKRAVKRKIE